MTSLELIYESAGESPRARNGLLGRLQRYWEGARRRRRERKLAIELSRLDVRLLRDIGIEPQDVTDALHGRPGPSILFHPMRRGHDPR